jgi:hypothetical protein
MTFDYQKIYDEFRTAYDAGTVNALGAGEVICRLSALFCNYNLELATATIAFNHAAAEIQNQPDESTGKGITSSKAEIMARATPESAAKILAEAHVKNLDTLIQSTKKLQEGLSQEFGHNN